MKLYVINLARERTRMQRLGTRLSELGLSYERIEAIDRLAMPETVLREQFGQSARSRRLPATPGDMACSLTHQNLWRHIAQCRAPAMVLEDDAWPADSLREWGEGRAEMVMQAHDLGLLRLEYWPDDPPSRRTLLGTPLETAAWGRLYRLRGSAFGSCAYVITPQAAALLLARFPRMEVPVDHHLSGERAAMGWRALRIGFVDPAPVWHDVLGLGSDMRGERMDLGIRQATWSGRGRWAKRRMALRHWALRATGRAQNVKLRFDGEPPIG